MSFNQEQFDTLIQKLEVFASKQPSGYRLRVALLATLGYAYIFAILSVTLALLAGIVWLMLNTRSFNAGALKAIIFLLAFGLILLRSLWVSFPPPTGLYVKRKDLPGLYAFVDELSAKLQAPRFHKILLTDDFNAAVAQRPRLGLLGRGSNETSWFIFERFLNWYVPFFNAYSFVLARMNEYEADRCAAGTYI